MKAHRDVRPVPGALHHVEIWVPDLERAAVSFGWLLEALGYTPFQSWDDGRSWRLGATYLVFERSAALTAAEHDRCRPGLNHLAFHVEDHRAVEALVAEAPRHGWTLMFPDSHPYAGGEATYAAYLEDADGFEVELVAIEGPEA
ncbi:VOC family protein [Streptomyces sp. NPDC089915]|uniref:VOC family protein n=1 Tax=Streptomyces sp. NPDC089915 TaxID=3155186 RepID=UPI00344194E5